MNPYHRLNLKNNPFGELSLSKRAKLSCVDSRLINQLSHLFETSNSIIQFVADHGRGKSTHLLHLHSHLTYQYDIDIPYLQLTHTQPMIWQPEQAYFVDSIEYLNIIERLRLYRKYPKLVVTTHKDLSAEMRLTGRKVTRIDIDQQDSDHVLRIFNTRVADAVLNPNKPSAFVGSNVINTLQTHCHNDIRAMESILYDMYYLLSQSDLTHVSSLVNSITPKLTAKAVNHKLTAISHAHVTYKLADTIIHTFKQDIVDWKTVY